jgi:hypothetical protein
MSSASKWESIRWLREPGDLTGRVIAVYGVNVQCADCLASALPQAQRVSELFPGSDVAVVAIQVVDEDASEAGTLVDRFPFPIGLDQQGASLKAFAWQATPALTLLDRHGRVRRSSSGVLPDLQLGAELMSLLREA